MDSIEAEDNDVKLHGAMCKQLAAIVHKIVGIFPAPEAAKPRSMSRVQPLTSLHVSIDMSMSLLQHCSNCSKLYLALTSDSVLMNFEKARFALQESLQNLEGPQSVGCEVMEIVGELETTVFNLDPLEKQAGDELIALLQKEKKLGDGEELEVFRQAALKLGLVSSKLVHAERKALKSLIETARTEEDKRKESTVVYLLHLMKKYSKIIRNEASDGEKSPVEGSDSCQVKDVQPVPSGKSTKVDDHIIVVANEDTGSEGFEKYDSLRTKLYDDGMTEQKCTAVEQIRFILKNDEQARIYMGANGFVEGLVQFLRLAIREGDAKAKENGAMALFNLAVNNTRNNEMLLSGGVMPLLEEMIENPDTYESAAALYLSLSYLSEAKPVIGESQAVLFLVHILQATHLRRLCREDAMHALFNLSTHPGNIESLVAAGIVDGLHPFLECLITASAEKVWARKAMAILANLASSTIGKAKMVSTPNLIRDIIEILDTGQAVEQELAVSCLLNLCEDEDCTQMVLQGGAAPSVIAISSTGTPTAMEKAYELLKIFRDHREQEEEMLLMEEQQLQPRYQMISGCGGVAHETMLHNMSIFARERVKSFFKSIWKLRHIFRFS